MISLNIIIIVAMAMGMMQKMVLEKMIDVNRYQDSVVVVCMMFVD